MKVTLSEPNGESETVEVLQVIDWEHPENNDFFAASQFWITGEMYTKRPDIVCFVNGIPLVLMEFKRIDVHLYAAYNDNLRDYKDTVPHLFWYNAFYSNALTTIQSRQSQSNDHPKTNLDVASHRKVDGNIQHLPEISDTVLPRKIVDPGFFG